MDHRERISRWMLAIGLLGCAGWLVRYGFNQTKLELFFPAMILAVIAISRVFSDLLELAAKPFTMLVDAIIFPKVSAGKPPPNYKLAEYYLKSGRLDDAEFEYRQIVKNHRKETQAYIGLIQLLAVAGESEEGEKILQQGRRYLRNHPECLSDIEMAWSEIQSQNFSI